MRISDWSSDVCSSDLNARHRRPQHEHRVDRRHRKIAVVGYDQPRGLRRFHRADEIDDFLRKVGPVDIGPIPGVVGEIGGADADPLVGGERSEEHTSELQSLMRISYAVFCLKKKKNKNIQNTIYEKSY